MQWAKQKQTGFTIVELLIVVVVIAILAAITIVAYNGISERARISGAASFASQLKKRDIVDAQGFYDFNECSGTTASNTGGRANTPSATFIGTPTFSSDTPSGSGCSISLNGISAIATDVPLSNEYYMKSAWIKTSASAVSQNIISVMSGAGGNAAFYVRDNGYVSGGHNGNWNSVSSSRALNDGKWHYVALEFKRNGSDTTGTLQLYIDGAAAGSPSSTAIMSDPGQVQAIGQFGSGSRFVGLIDDVMIVTK